jgi:ATP-dependent DNA helicase DinG
LRLPSPFSFEQVDFIIAKFKAAPQQVYEHTQEVATQLLQRIDSNQGTLVLFASNKQMQMVADLVENKLEPHLLIQGEFSKKAILEKHINLRQQNQGSVIFGHFLCVFVDLLRRGFKFGNDEIYLFKRKRRR